MKKTRLYFWVLVTLTGLFWVTEASGDPTYVLSYTTIPSKEQPNAWTCAPTSGYMLLEYWDNNNFDKILDDTKSFSTHISEIGNHMGTTSSGTDYENVDDAIKHYYTDTGHGGYTGGWATWYSASWAKYIAEINANHPTILGISGHAVLGYGYEIIDTTYKIYTYDPYDGQSGPNIWTVNSTTLHIDAATYKNIKGTSYVSNTIDLIMSSYPVPAPSALVLGALGLAYTSWRLRRRKEL